MGPISRCGHVSRLLPGVHAAWKASHLHEHWYPQEGRSVLSRFILPLSGIVRAHYSKELSEKYSKAGEVKIAQQGFRPGGTPLYALCRMLLQRIEEASPGPEARRKGRAFKISGSRWHRAEEKERVDRCPPHFSNRLWMAQTKVPSRCHLNRDHMLSPGGAQWSAENVRHILRNEMYTGTIVYNKTTQRLLSASKPNPLTRWSEPMTHFEAVISQEI